MLSQWKVIDAGLRRLARAEAAHAFEVGVFILAARRLAVHLELGLGSHHEYIGRVLGYERRTVTEHGRVAEALEGLPLLAAALREGEIVWSIVRELTRVAVLETEAEWLKMAAGRTALEVEEAVSGRRPGDRPDSPADPRPLTRAIRLELPPEGVALYREAIGRMRREVEGGLTEEEALMEILRRALGGPGDEGRAPYQVAVTTCAQCGRTWQEGHGEAIEVDAEVGERAACDAQVIEVERAHVGASVTRPKRASQTIPPATRRAVVRRDHGRCRVPGCRNAAWLEVHHVTSRAEGGRHDADGLLLLCGTHHRLLHRGYLIISGLHPAFEFRHADGTIYGAALRPAAVEASADAFSALTNMGLGDGEAKRALAEARAHVGTEASVEDSIRAALRAHGAARTRAYEILPPRPPIDEVREESPVYGVRLAA